MINDINTERFREVELNMRKREFYRISKSYVQTEKTIL